jgi:hypothetical protein
MRAYELVERQDLAALDRYVKPSSKLQYIDGETIKDYGIKDEQDDGMEFDDTVYALYSYGISHRYRINAF